MNEPTKSYPYLQRPENEDFWVFGYGSLMWNPGFPHLEVQVALLRGYHRRFCIYSVHYRGTQDCPGLVLGLDRGGSCRGLAFRVPAAEGDAVMHYLYEREMLQKVYRPRWLKVHLPAGPVQACGFVVNRNHQQYTGHLSLEETAAYIAQGRGNRGQCREYLANTLAHLDALGIGDSGLGDLLVEVDRIQVMPSRRGSKSRG